MNELNNKSLVGVEVVRISSCTIGDQDQADEDNCMPLIPGWYSDLWRVDNGSVCTVTHPQLGKGKTFPLVTWSSGVFDNQLEAIEDALGYIKRATGINPGRCF